MAADGSTTAGGGERLDSHSCPRRLMSEAVSLALILGAVLTASALERRGYLAGDGYLSSLLLFGASFGHARYFGRNVRWIHSRRAGAFWSGSLAAGLVSLLLASAWCPVAPQPGTGLPLGPALHLLVIVPLSEELYFRGVLLDHLRRGFGPVRAVLLTTLLFAALHLPVGAVLVAGALSLIACVLTVRTGAVGCAVQLHVAWNAITQIHQIGDPGPRWWWAVATVILVGALASGACVYRGGTDEPTA